jgi:hypothetical protein
VGGIRVAGTPSYSVDDCFSTTRFADERNNKPITRRMTNMKAIRDMKRLGCDTMVLQCGQGQKHPVKTSISIELQGNRHCRIEAGKDLQIMGQRTVGFAKHAVDLVQNSSTDGIKHIGLDH